MRRALLWGAISVWGCGAPAAPGAGLQPAPAASAAPSAVPSAAPSVGEPELKLRDDVVVTGGVHGNEPSGAAVLAELEEAGFQTFGPCNPWGIENGSRYLEDGSDLNRRFADDDLPEVAAVKAFLESHRPGLLLDLHEDGVASDAYLIQHGPDDDLGRRIIDELDDDIAFDPKPKFKVVEGQDGLIKPGAMALGVVKLSGVYGLAFHAWQAYGVTTCVVEVPSVWPLAKRRRTHLRIVQTARRIFSERGAPSD